MKIIGRRHKKFLDHEHTIDALIRRLLLVGRYDSISKNEVYHTNTYCGEFDVLTRRTINGRTYFNYYEVKCNDCSGRYTHSLHQFERARKAFPNRLWRFIYVTPTYVERVHT